MNRLYIVEGLPCSGKSSTARFLANVLEAKGHEVCNIDEGTLQHPADYEFHAYADDQIIPLAGLTGEALNKLLPCKIYDGLP